jgi:hypothetical protein
MESKNRLKSITFGALFISFLFLVNSVKLIRFDICGAFLSTKVIDELIIAGSIAWICFALLA